MSWSKAACTLRFDSICSQVIEFKSSNGSNETIAILCTSVPEELREKDLTSLESIVRQDLVDRDSAKDPNEKYFAIHYQYWNKYAKRVSKPSVQQQTLTIDLGFQASGDFLDNSPGDSPDNSLLFTLNNKSRQCLPRQSNEMERDKEEYHRIINELGLYFVYASEVVSFYLLPPYF